MTTTMAAGALPAESSESDGPEGYARIGDMAREFGVTLRALRFYEDRGLIHPKREGTTRLYARRDRARLRLILLGRRIGFSLRDVKQMLDLYDPDGTNARQLRVVLQKSERQLARLEQERDGLGEAIADLDRLMSEVRARLGGPSAVGGQPADKL